MHPPTPAPGPDPSDGPAPQSPVAGGQQDGTAPRGAHPVSEALQEGVGQPAVARRTVPLLRQLGSALALAVASVGTSLMASRTLVEVDEGARIWPVVSNVAAVLVMVACAVQWWVWRTAQQEWSGRRDVAMMGLLGPSRVARVVGGAAGIVGPLAALQVWQDTGSEEAVHWWTLTTAVLLVLATGFGAIHPLDPAGPRGVGPRRLRVQRDHG